MAEVLLQRPRYSRPEPRFASMLGISLGVHLLVVLLFAGGLLPRLGQERKPVYVVDLVNLPVANPQAGRPDARPAPPKPAALPKPAAPPEAPAKIVRPEPQPEPKAPVKPAPKAEPKPAVKALPKPAPKPKPAPPAPTASYEDTLDKLAEMRRKQEIAQLKQSLAALAGQDTRQQPAVKAPLGEEKGTGTEAGVGLGLWLQSYYKQAWSLSKYQVSRLDLETRVTVTFDGRGHLKNYSIVESSGDSRFDASVTQAVRSLDKLEYQPGHTVTETVKFNLKDLMDR